MLINTFASGLHSFITEINEPFRFENACVRLNIWVLGRFSHENFAQDRKC